MIDSKKNFATTLNSERGRFILNKVLNQDFKNSQIGKLDFETNQVESNNTFSRNECDIN